MLMNLPGILAEADLGTLIYVIAVVIWVISNALGAKKKAKRRGMPVPRPDESSAERELREFIETIAGTPPAPEPEPLPKPPPAIVQRKRERPKPTVPVYAPATAAAMRSQTGTVSVEDIAADLRSRAPGLTGSFSTNLSSMASLFKTSGLTMPALRYALSTTQPRPAFPVINGQLLSNKDDLRRLVAGQIVLGSPRALDPYQPIGR